MQNNKEMHHTRKMSTKDKIANELESIFWTSMYFLLWFSGLMLIKVLLLREYHIEFSGYAIVIIGALIVAKAVLLLEYIHIPFTKNKPAWMEVITRTLLYSIGVFVIMSLEKSFEARNEFGGVIEAYKNLSKQADIYHLWINIICVSGALLFFNIWTVMKKHYGDGIFRKIMSSPVPE
jgi:hypothetical protein